jgi:oligopeptidase A
MSADNPLLDPSELPRFSAIKPEHVAPAIDAIIAEYRAQIDALSAAEPTWAQLMQPQEELDERLSRVFSPVSHLHSVMDSPALREVYSAALDQITDFEAELGQNRALYQAVQALRDGPAYATLERSQRTIVDDALRDFRLSGVALEEPARSRFRAIATELSRLSTEFEQALLDATDAWHRDIADAQQLAGVPESGLAMMRQAAGEAGVAGFRVTLKQPVYLAVMTYARDRELRRELYTAYQTRASDQGPHAGQFDNSARIEQIMALRHEAAQLLGFADAAEESLVTSSSSTPPTTWASPSWSIGTCLMPRSACARRAMRSTKRN